MHLCQGLNKQKRSEKQKAKREQQTEWNPGKSLKIRQQHHRKEKKKEYENHRARPSFKRDTKKKKKQKFGNKTEQKGKEHLRPPIGSSYTHYQVGMGMKGMVQITTSTGHPGNKNGRINASTPIHVYTGAIKISRSCLSDLDSNYY